LASPFGAGHQQHGVRRAEQRGDFGVREWPGQAHAIGQSLGIDQCLKAGVVRPGADDQQRRPRQPGRRLHRQCLSLARDQRADGDDQRSGDAERGLGSLAVDRREAVPVDACVVDGDPLGRHAQARHHLLQRGADGEQAPRRSPGRQDLRRHAPDLAPILDVRSPRLDGKRHSERCGQSHRRRPVGPEELRIDDVEAEQQPQLAQLG
jgi:hypothetical protein